MHELGIVFYIIKDVKEAAAENGVSHVDAVVMNIGEVSTVVPEYLTDCWRWAADKEAVLQGSIPSRLCRTARTAGRSSRRSASERPARTAKAARPTCSVVMKWRSRK